MDDDADRRCMARLRDGDDLALNELMRRWREPLVAFCVRYSGNLTDAREIAHETFVRVYSARMRYRPSAAFSTWLFTIANNLCRMRNRWRRRHPELLEADREATLDSQDAANSHRDPSVEADRRDLGEDLARAIRQLPHHLRSAFVLHALQGMTQGEIAAIQQTTEKAIERRLSRAREKLRNLLESKWGGD